MKPDASSSRTDMASRFRRLAPTLALTVLMGGCATVKNPNPADPWEGMNRSINTFNETIDGALLKPVSLAYQDLTPRPIRTCISNIFNNLGDVWSAANSFLQGRGHDFFNTLGRVLFNSTMGLGGCIDVASMNGAPRIENDFGVTLGVWGFESGPYVVLPFLGASTLRDGIADVSLMAAGASSNAPITGGIDNVPLRNSILGLRIIDRRANLLEADRLVNEVALDRYSFIRDAYLQQRKSKVDQRRHHPGQPSNVSNNLPDYENDLPNYDDDEADASAVPAAN